jgi:hypothetical protein
LYKTKLSQATAHRYLDAGALYPHLFRHQIITFLTKRGIISPKLQLLSGHAEEKNLAIYRDLALADVSAEYEEAMQSFPVR